MSFQPRTGIYPGTFDPMTKGHSDIIKRALRVVDHLVVAVARNAGKDPLFTVEQRVDLASEEIRSQGLEHMVTVVAFDQLLVDLAASMNATAIIRGLRAVSDFEYEFQMAGMNRRLHPDIETVFLMASDKHQFVSSRLIKEIYRLNGDISQFVSPHVIDALQNRLKTA